MKKLIFYVLVMLASQISLSAQTIVTVGGSGANYATLKLAFDAINSGVLTGIIEIQITGNTTETAAAILNASGVPSNYSSITIYPTGPGYTISGSVIAPLIDLNGADNVTFDGRVNRTGTSQDLTITNTSTSNSNFTSTFRLYESATNDVIRYCTIKGSTGANKGANILIHVSSTGPGNNNITIENNNLTSNNGNRPLNLIYSAGSSSRPNSNIKLQNNSLYNFFKSNQTSYGIFLSSLNSNWTITGNSFYETTIFAPSVTNLEYDVIRVNYNTSGGLVITGNYIGGSSPLCGGSPWTKNSNSDNPFYAIKLSLGDYPTNSIQGNTIQNFTWRNSGTATWTGIYIDAGSVNIGNVLGNTIGSTSSTGSIAVSGGATGFNFYGINIITSNSVNCQNNNIGSITAANTGSSNASNIYAIYKGPYPGNTTISNNTIGSTSTSNSINASSTSSGNNQNVHGISNSGTGIITISNNTISNLVNASNNSTSSNRGKVSGICSSAGSNTISGNIVHDLLISNNNDASDQSSSVSGIAISGTSSSNSVSGNTVYNLSNNNSSSSSSVIGVFFGGGSGNHNVSQNFIHSLSAASASTTSSIYGVKTYSGTTTYSNNIISLGGNISATIYGYFDSGNSGNNNSLYFNTIFIGGIASSGSSKSYALYNNGNSNSRDFRNNIFVNTRSTAGGTDLHYAEYIVSSGGTIICDYNDYFVSGSGGTLGFYGGNRTGLPIVTANDVNSVNSDPVFNSPGSSVATDYQIGIDLLGIAIPGITTDFGSFLRVAPTIGAWERMLNRWKGTLSTDFNTPGNWTGNIVPTGTDPNIFFDDNPDQACYLDQDRSFTNITNRQSTDRLVTNGHKLTVKGNLNFTNGAQIESSSTSSIVEFAGIVTQTIPASSFFNDQVFDLIINNINNVTLNGNLNLLGNLTAPNGLLDASTASPTFIFGGSNPQTINSHLFLDTTIFNLTIDNSSVPGASLNTGISVTNALTINSGRIFSIDPPGKATISSLINNGILNLNSTGSSSIFSMIVDSYSGAGTSNAQLFITGGGAPYYNWHYVAEPFVSGMPIDPVTAVNDKNLLSYNDNRVVTSDFNGWEYYNGYSGTNGIAGGAGFTTMSYGKGYNFYNGTDATITLSGSTSIGTTLGNIPLQYSGPVSGSTIFGYNLLGNSLTCSIDWDKAIISGSAGTAVYYTIGNKWATYLAGGGGLGLNGATNIIPPLQGFFVKANDSGAGIDFSSARTHSSQPRYKKSLAIVPDSKGATVFPKIKLELNGTGTSDETILWYNNDASTEYDEKFDAIKMFASEAIFSQVYTILEGKNYCINGIPLPNDSIIIPLGIKIAKTGSYSLIRKDFIAPVGFITYLVDKTNNVIVNLGKTDTYQFSSDKGNFADRFELLIKAIVTGIEDPKTENKDFNIYGFHNMVNITPMISTMNYSKGTIRIFDLTGKKVKEIINVEWLEGNQVQVSCEGLQGIFMVEAGTGSRRYVGKVFLH